MTSMCPLDQVGSNYLFIYESAMWKDRSHDSVVISDMYLMRYMNRDQGRKVHQTSLWNGWLSIPYVWREMKRPQSRSVAIGLD